MKGGKEGRERGKEERGRDGEIKGEESPVPFFGAALIDLALISFR